MTTYTLKSPFLQAIVGLDGIQAISFGSSNLLPSPQPVQGPYDDAGWRGGNTGGSLGTVLSSSLSLLTSPSQQVVLTQLFLESAQCKTTYSLTGSDIFVEVAISNTGTTPLNDIAIQCPQFQFTGTIAGDLCSWPSAQIRANLESYPHPCQFNPLAVAWATDSIHAVAMHCQSHLTRQTLFNSSPESSDNTTGTPQPISSVALYIVDQIEPGGSITVSYTIRVLPPAATLTELMSSYVADVQKIVGKQTYTSPPPGPWMSKQDIAATFVSPANPLGYNAPPNYRRFDTVQGCTEMAAWIAPLAKQMPVFMCWQPQGWSARGCQPWRADFTNLGVVATTLPALIAACNSMSVKVGLLIAPTRWTTLLNATSDQTIFLDGADLQWQNFILSQIALAEGMGVGAAFLDSFGLHANDYLMMSAIRTKVGPSFPTISEFSSDLVARDSGLYVRLIPDADGIYRGNTQNYSLQTIQILQMIYPGMLIVADAIPAGMTAAQLAAWGMTPLVLDYQMPAWLGIAQTA